MICKAIPNSKINVY